MLGSCGRGAVRAVSVSKQLVRNKSLYIPSSRMPAGRSSNASDLTVTVFGGSGFIGRYFFHELGCSGVRTYAPFRGEECDMRHIKVMFDLGQLGLIPFSPRDDESIMQCLSHSDVVVNMVGKHYETKNILPTLRANGEYSRVNYSFEEVHRDFPAKLAQLSKQAGVKGFLQVSALSADEGSRSKWSRTRAQGELAVKEHFPEAIIVKLATVFGPEDRFLTRIADASKARAFFPLLNGGSNLVQPVYSGDVGKGLMEIVKHYNLLQGKTFQFAGPAEYSHKEVAEFVQDVTLLHKPLVDVPVSWARIAGRALEHLTDPRWTEDMLEQVLEDTVKKPDPSLLTLQDLGIEPGSMDALSFDFLHRFRAGGHFSLVRGYH